MALVGTPYRYGGNAAETGFDCSGLVQYVYQNAYRLRLPRASAEQAKQGDAVSPEQLATGDLLFYNTDGSNPASHVAIYVGQGRMVHAPTRGGTVRIESMTKPYWTARFTMARRLRVASNP